MIRPATVLLALLLAAIPAAAQQTASIEGRVFTSAGQPATDAVVTITELRRSVRVAEDGSFRFTGLRPGHYHVEAESPRSGSAIADIRLSAGENRTVELAVDPIVHREEIVVSASADARRESEVYQPIHVVNEEEVAERLQATLGETLNREPGVNSTFFGAGASRPIIRGLGADRIRLLTDGVGSNDASNVSPDHAVSIEPAAAERIEILRGPATLLYGSNAVGGVVNVLDDRVPSRVPTAPVSGFLDLRGGTVAEEKAGSINLHGGANRWAWRAGYSYRDAGDYEIPGPADEHDDEPDELTGVLENSALENRNAILGGSFVGSRGFIGLAYNDYRSLYGVPGHHHHDEEEEGEEEEAAVRVDLDQRRIDFKGELFDLGNFFRNARLRIGRTDYEHTELEGDAVGTRFLSEGIEGRLEASHRQIGRIRGTWGAQLSDIDLQAIGEEAFVPPNSTSSRAIFAFEEIVSDRWDLQLGGRYEDQEVSTNAEGLPDRSFDGLSGSIGAIFRPAAEWGVALSLARAVRIPTATELYANGPHAATRQFEIGDPNLIEEESLGIDLSIRRNAGRFRGELNLFQNYFDGFIYERPTGEEEDDLPVFQYVQDDARFQGIEIATHTELWHEGANHLELELGADYVRAKLDEGDENLPRIPPLRVSAGLRWRSGPISANAEVWRYSKQDATAPYEEETDGYTLVNAMISYRFFAGNTVHDIMLRGTNLTDELARVHTSPLKDLAPLPGRDLTLAYRLTF